MTSFSMSGISITLMAVDQRSIKLLDKPANSPAWTQLKSLPKFLNTDLEFRLQTSIDINDVEDVMDFPNNIFNFCVEAACKDLVTIFISIYLYVFK